MRAIELYEGLISNKILSKKIEDAAEEGLELGESDFIIEILVFMFKHNWVRLNHSSTETNMQAGNLKDIVRAARRISNLDTLFFHVWDGDETLPEESGRLTGEQLRLFLKYGQVSKSSMVNEQSKPKPKQSNSKIKMPKMIGWINSKTGIWYGWGPETNKNYSGDDDYSVGQHMNHKLFVYVNPELFGYKHVYNPDIMQEGPEIKVLYDDKKFTIQEIAEGASAPYIQIIDKKTKKEFSLRSFFDLLGTGASDPQELEFFFTSGISRILEKLDAKNKFYYPFPITVIDHNKHIYRFKDKKQIYQYDRKLSRTEAKSLNLA